MATYDVSIRPGVTVTLEIDDVTGKMSLRHSADIQPLLEQAARERNARSDWRPWQGNTKLGGAVKVCSLSDIDQLNLVQMGIASFEGGFKILDERAFQRWLDSHPEKKSTRGRAFDV